jgi:hypothetical protein
MCCFTHTTENLIRVRVLVPRQRQRRVAYHAYFGMPTRNIRCATEGQWFRACGGDASLIQFGETPRPSSTKCNPKPNPKPKPKHTPNKGHGAGNAGNALVASSKPGAGTAVGAVVRARAGARASVSTSAGAGARASASGRSTAVAVDTTNAGTKSAIQRAVTERPLPPTATAAPTAPSAPSGVAPRGGSAFVPFSRTSNSLVEDG